MVHFTFKSSSFLRLFLHFFLFAFFSLHFLSLFASHCALCIMHSTLCICLTWILTCKFNSLHAYILLSTVSITVSTSTLCIRYLLYVLYVGHAPDQNGEKIFFFPPPSPMIWWTITNGDNNGFALLRCPLKEFDSFIHLLCMYCISTGTYYVLYIQYCTCTCTCTCTYTLA